MLVLYKEMKCFATHNNYRTYRKAYMHTNGVAMYRYSKSDKNNVILEVSSRHKLGPSPFSGSAVDSFVSCVLASLSLV